MKFIPIIFPNNITSLMKGQTRGAFGVDKRGELQGLGKKLSSI